MVDTFLMDQQFPEPQTFDMNTSNQVNISPEVASNRVSKATYALAPMLDVSPTDINSYITNGQEGVLRDQVAAGLDQKKQADLQSQIQTKVAQGPLTPEVSNWVLNAVNNNKPSDPQSVLEDAFAVKYVNNIYTVNGRTPNAPQFSWFNDLISSFPQEVQDQTDLATEATAKHLFSVKQLEEAGGEVEKMSNVNWGIMQMMNLSQAYPELKLRDNVPGTGMLTGGFLGSNLEAQRLKLYQLPYDQFKVQYKAIMDNLIGKGDALLAQRFANAMTDYTLDDKNLDNLFSIATPFEAIQVAGLVGRGARMALGGGMKNLVQATEALSHQPPSVVAAAGAGDLTEAAIQKSTLNNIKGFAGLNDFDKQAVEALTSNFRLDKTDIRANPGRFGQEIVNRLDEVYNAGENSFINAVATFMRVNRTPAAIASEDVVRAVQQNLRGEFKGIDNAILNVSEPIHSQMANGYFYEFHIGTTEGEYFKNPEEAKNFAELNGLRVKPNLQTNAFNIVQEFPNPKVRVMGEAKPSGIRPTPTAANENVGTAATKSTTSAPEFANTRFGGKPTQAANVNLSPEQLKAEGYQIKNNGSGLGYYINVPKFFPETSDIMRDGLISRQYDNVGDYRRAMNAGEVSTSIPPTWFNKYLNASLGWIRTPEETLSRAENAQRKIAAHSPSTLIKAIEEIGTPLRDLPQKYHKDFVRLLEHGQRKPDPSTGISGYTWKSPGDLEGAYQGLLGRLPHPDEIAAYFSYKQLNEVDLSLRKMAIYRNESRAGVEMHQFSSVGPDGAKKSGFFKGIRQSEFPGGDDTVTVIGKQVGKEEHYPANAIPPRMRNKLVEQVKKGEKTVIRIWNPEEFPLANFSDTTAGVRSRYVIADSFEHSPLSWDNLPRRGGGHLVPDYDHYIKQGIIHREVLNAKGAAPKITDWYHGDRTIMPVGIRAMGENIVRHMNEVRTRILKGDIAGAESYSNQHLPFDWDTHYGWYKPGRDPAGNKLEPRLDPKQPIRVVPKDKMIAHIDKDLENSFAFKDKNGNNGNTFKDGTRQGSDARMAQVEFTGQRDAYELYTVEAKGSTKNPLYSYVPGQYVDPITAMDRGLAKITTSTFMDDYKIFAAEHWLRQASKYLDASESELRSAPFYHFNNPKFKDGVPIEDKLLLLNNLKKAKDFISRPSIVDKWADSAANKIADSIYNTTGKAGIAEKVVALRDVPGLRDPISVVRSVAFNLKQGLFSVKTFFSQFATFSNIWAISPKHAPSATGATMLYTVSRYNKAPETMAYLDKMATEIGRGTPDLIMHKYKPGWFSEATDLLHNSGFANVGHEHAIVDTPVSIDVFSNRVKGMWDNVKNWGRLPFDLGSQSTRIGGFYTAHLEWRIANPMSKLTRDVEDQILERASLLDHNMSRASNSPVHTGVMSIPMQFNAYALRLSEMLTGKRLTPGEKSRLIASSALLYGIPVGVVGSYGVPMADYIRKVALDKFNYVVGDNLAVSTAMEGGIATLAAFITGRGDTKKGNWYNTSKWGTKGIEALDTALASDKTFIDVVGGVSWSTLKSLNSSSQGLLMAMKSFVSPEDPNSPNYFPVMLSDVTDILKEISSANDISKAVAAYNQGTWVDKKGGILQKDVGATNGIFMAGMGLNPQAAMDMYNKNDILKEMRTQERAAANLAIKEWRRGIDAANSDDPEGGKKHFIRAMAALDAVNYPIDRRSSVLQLASEGYEDQIKQVDWNFYVKNVQGKPDLIEGRQKAFQQMQNLGQ